mmetsp:Transcript_2469/g.6267  ORF Transcript_2469/g.6267 Transcript_2469/m.6267 type:complete len:205 (+) Transcript_2469:261-875(+)
MRGTAGPCPPLGIHPAAGLHFLALLLGQLAVHVVVAHVAQAHPQLVVQVHRVQPPARLVQHARAVLSAAPDGQPRQVPRRELQRPAAELQREAVDAEVGAPRVGVLRGRHGSAAADGGVEPRPAHHVVHAPGGPHHLQHDAARDDGGGCPAAGALRRPDELPGADQLLLTERRPLRGAQLRQRLERLLHARRPITWMCAPAQLV